MKPISAEKRELIISAKQRGEKEKDIAVWFCVSKKSVGTIWRLYKNRGSFLSIPYKGRLSKISESISNKICSAINTTPDITLNELIEQLSLPIKKSQLSKLLIKFGFSYKKRLFIQKNNSGKMSNKNELNGGKRKIH